jgi:hypothetical protein
MPFHDPELVRDIVAQVRRGRVASAVAREVGVDEALVISWVEEAREREDDARSDGSWGGEDDDRVGWYSRQQAWRLPAAIIAASLLAFLVVAVPVTLLTALFAAEWARGIPVPDEDATAKDAPAAP